jgi:superfamily II DNA/RNA helicase
LKPSEGGWVWEAKEVKPYLQRELVPRIPTDIYSGRPIGEIDDLDMPYPLIALIIAWVIAKSDDGHVLVFLPGWDEIQAVRLILQDRAKFPLLDINFNSPKYEIHILHSSIPIAEQQAVFEPPEKGIRRIVLSTNIAETSVTIPDVVFVVDSAKCREKRYDPERRLSQLVSAWTGTSNVLQRAGRAGRHRPGEYYGIVSKARFAAMDIHQTVEMVRSPLCLPSRDGKLILSCVSSEPISPEPVCTSRACISQVSESKTSLLPQFSRLSALEFTPR